MKFCGTVGHGPETDRLDVECVWFILWVTLFIIYLTCSVLMTVSQWTIMFSLSLCLSLSLSLMLHTENNNPHWDSHCWQWTD